MPVVSSEFSEALDRFNNLTLWFTGNIRGVAFCGCTYAACNHCTNGFADNGGNLTNVAGWLFYRCMGRSLTPPFYPGCSSVRTLTHRISHYCGIPARYTDTYLRSHLHCVLAISGSKRAVG